MDGKIHYYRRGDKVDFPIPELPIPNTTKHTAGYYLRPNLDWIDLFTGSEGTLGIVLEAEVTLLPIPPELLTAVIFFADDSAALDAVDEWRSWFGSNAQDRERFRLFRHALPERVNDTVRRNGSLKMGTDFAVPLDRNRDMLSIYRERCDRYFPNQYVIFGHIGEAHLHVNLLPTTSAGQDQAQELIPNLAKEVVRLGGTVSAEHGLGKRKANLLGLQFTPDQIESMKKVKRHLDPEWRLGGGTLFPQQP
jgi:FAD/FMN-containing dehydrogenase